MGQKDDVLGGCRDVLLHQSLEILRKVTPGFTAVGGGQHVDTFIHVEQVRQGIYHNGVDFRVFFRRDKRFLNLVRVGDDELPELGGEG